MDASFIIYTGLPTTNIPISPAQNLQTILQNIDAAIAAHGVAPDYASFTYCYAPNCIYQTDGSTLPNTVKNFTEGISKIVCNNRALYDTFVGTTYVSDKGVFTSAISGLQTPTISAPGPFTIVNGDGVNAIWNKLLPGIATMLTAENPSSASWSTLSITPPTTITTGFGSLITYLSSLATTVAGKQIAIGTFNNSANCLTTLGGTSADTISATIGFLTTKVCSLPTYTVSGLTWGCVSTASDLQSTIVNILASLNSVNNQTITSVGTGLAAGSPACGGRTLTIDTTWSGLYKVAPTSAGVANNDYLGNILTSTDGSITIDSSSNTHVNLAVTTPQDGKVKASSSDTTRDYLQNKITGANGSWGLTTSISTAADNHSVVVSAGVGDPTLFVSTMLDVIASDPDLLALFTSVMAAAAGSCGAPSNLVVTFTSPTPAFTLTWIAPGGASLSQTAYSRGINTPWQSTYPFITPANPLGPTATSVVVQNTVNPTINRVMEFRVDSACPAGAQSSPIVQAICFVCPTITRSYSAGVISASIPVFYSLDQVIFTLYKDGALFAGPTIAPGTAPSVTFGGVTTGHVYNVKVEMKAMVNGIMVSSVDAGQLGSICSSTDLTI